MMEKFPPVEILKELKMIMTMVDTFSRVGNLKTPMLVMLKVFSNVLYSLQE